MLETLLPRLALDLSVKVSELAVLFPGPVEALQLEIGFGSGEHLIGEAKSHPRWGFIGVEPFVNGMAKALGSIADHSLWNVRLHHGEASDLLAWLPEQSLDRIDLLYPDPWPKRRHWKRRFVQEQSLLELARVLRPGGELRFASDVADYAVWTLQRLLGSSAFEWTAEAAADWKNAWPGYCSTRYELKARREGRVPCYLVFRKAGDPPDTAH